jgi:hypothetical protein
VTLFNSPIFGGPYWPYEHQPIEVQAVRVPPAKPQEGEQTHRQDAGPGRAFGCLCGYPNAPYGDYPIWRLMDADPALTMSRAAITAPIRAADKSYEAVEGASDDRTERIRSVADRLWAEYVMEALDAPSMGWAGFEKVWGRRDGMWVIVDLKPLPQEGNTILVTPTGAYAGLRTLGLDNRQLDLSPLYSFVYTIDGKKRNFYGRPWHENARQTWHNKMMALVELAKLNKKASGIQPKMYYPPGTDSATGKSNRDLATEYIAAYMGGNGLALPSLAGTINADSLADYRNIQGLAETALWDIKVEDFGNNAPAAASILAQIQYYNAELSRAWHVPERAVQEGQHGTKAEAETHGDIALTVAELVYGDICAAFNRGVVDDLLAVNFGEAARGTVMVKPGRLTDVWAGTDLALLNGLIVNADTLMALVEVVDWDALLTRRGVPKVKGVIDLAKTLADKTTQKLAAQAKIAAQTPPTPRGGNGDATALARANGEGGHIERLVRMLGEEG